MKSEQSARPPGGVYEKVCGSEEWWVRYAHASSRVHREKAGTKSRAIKLSQKRKTEVLQGRKLPETIHRARFTFREIAEDAIADILKRYRRPKEESARLRLRIKWIGSRAAEEITAAEFDENLTGGGEAHKWKLSTINHHRSVLSLAYRLARRHDPPKVTTNPVRDVPPRKQDNSRVRFLSDAEVETLRDVIVNRYPEYLVEFDFSRFTGLRQGP